MVKKCKLSQVILLICIIMQLFALSGCVFDKANKDVGQKENEGNEKIAMSINAQNTGVPPKQSSVETLLFSRGDFSVKVTNVAYSGIQNGFDDGLNPREIVVYYVYPDAEISVIDAGMSEILNAQFEDNGVNWGIYYSSDEVTYIKNEMSPIEITSDLIGIIHLESSSFVLLFKPYDESLF